MHPSEELTYRQGVIQALERIEMQTVKTNGRVTKLERWQSYVLGFCACLTAIVLPVALYIVTHFRGV